MTTAVDSHERPKDFLTASEVARLIQGASRARYPERDQAIISFLFHHGFRESELTATRRSDIDLNSARIWVRRVKKSLSTHQPIPGDELRLLRRYLRTRTDSMPWLFISERGGPLSRHSIIYIVGRTGQLAGLGHVHPHMLRHSCGYELANRGYDSRLIQDYLGHRDPKHTAKYTRTAASRFEKLWS
jgi:type 1 fimbriae regulatory protein FimB